MTCALARTWKEGEERALIGENESAPSTGGRALMAPQKRHADARRVAGLAIRTTNAAETSPSTAKIPSLWQRFMTERWGDQLESLGALGPPIAVYSAYESDASGSYQLLVGREVPVSTKVSAPLQVVSLPDASYLVFPCPGPVPQAVIDGWQEVWSRFGRKGAPTRSYTYDFEIYVEGKPVEIWVSVDQG